jgi:hypothetical protein
VWHTLGRKGRDDTHRRYYAWRNQKAATEKAWGRQMTKKRDLVERTQSVDVRELARDHAFSQAPRWFPFLGLTTNRFRVEYRGHRWPAERRTQVIAVTRTRCRFGGTRPWFVCSCGKRAAILYPGVLGLLCCRKCAGLAYQSQLWGKRRRIYRKAQEIRRFFDNHGRPGIDAKPQRPRGMRRKTYARLMATLGSLEWRLSQGKPYRPKTRRRANSEINSR